MTILLNPLVFLQADVMLSLNGFLLFIENYNLLMMAGEDCIGWKVRWPIGFIPVCCEGLIFALLPCLILVAGWSYHMQSLQSYQ